MSETIDQYAPRENLRRTISYRPHIKWIYYSLKAISLAMLLYFLFLTYQFYSYGSQVETFGILFLGLLFPFAFYLQAEVLIRPMAFATVHVQPDRLILEALNKKEEILFSDIDTVRLFHLSYFGGWFQIILKDKRKFKFTVALERSEYILEAVTSYKPELLAYKSFMQYRKAAILSDHSWARIQDDLKNWQSKVIKFFMVPLLFTLVVNTFYNSSLFDRFGYILVFNGLLCVVVSIVFDLIVSGEGSKRLDRNPKSAIRDLVYEKKMNQIEDRVYWIAIVFFAALLIFVTK